MYSSWIENYRGKWKNDEGFTIVIRPIDEKSASVDIILNGQPMRRPWCGNAPSNNLSALYRDDEGLGLEIDLGRDGFALFLDYESAGTIYGSECIVAGISWLEADREAEQWTSLFGIETYFRSQ